MLRGVNEGAEFPSASNQRKERFMSIDTKNDWVQSPADLLCTTGYGAAAQPVATAPAGTGNQRNAAKRITFSLGSIGTTQPPLLVALINGTSGQSGSTALYLAQWAFPAIPTSTGGQIDFDNLHIPGSAATPMTLMPTAAPAAATISAVNLQSYLFPKAPAQLTY